MCQVEFAPGGQQLCVSEVQHHIQEVVTPEDPPLQQQEAKTDAIPDDPRLVAGQLTLLSALSLRCKRQMSVNSRRRRDGGVRDLKMKTVPYVYRIL